MFLHLRCKPRWFKECMGKRLAAGTVSELLFYKMPAKPPQRVFKCIKLHVCFVFLLDLAGDSYLKSS